MLLYHSSPSLFYQFRELSHFGTIKAALDRSNAYDGDTYIYTCEIDTNNIKTIYDYGNESDMLYDDLFRQKLITKKEFDLLKNVLDYRKRSVILKDILLGKNIKIMKYDNVAEDVNSSSYIVVDPVKIKILSIRKMKG